MKRFRDSRDWEARCFPLLRNPWPADMPYWKNRWQGASQSLFFIARPEKSQRFVEIVETVAPKHGYPVADIGSYIQPIEHNRACQVEFTFFYDEKQCSGESAHRRSIQGCSAGSDE